MSVRLKLTLSYAGFVMLAGVLLLAAVWVFLNRATHVGLIIEPNYRYAVRGHAGAPRDRPLPNLRGSDEQLVAARDSLPLRGKGAEQQLGLVQLGPCEHQSQLPAAEGGLDRLKRVDPDLGRAVGCRAWKWGGP